MIGRERVMECRVIVCVYLGKNQSHHHVRGCVQDSLARESRFCKFVYMCTCVCACVGGGWHARARFTYATLFAHSYMHVSDVDTLVYVYYT